MARNDAVREAAFFGLAGTVLVSVGSFVASVIFTALNPWLGAVPAVLVWGVCVFYGMQQFAHGIYTIVEDVRTP